MSPPRSVLVLDSDLTTSEPTVDAEPDTQLVLASGLAEAILLLELCDDFERVLIGEADTEDGMLLLGLMRRDHRLVAHRDTPVEVLVAIDAYADVDLVREPAVTRPRPPVVPAGLRSAA